MKYLNIIRMFFLTDWFGAPIFKVLVFWFVGILGVGTSYQNTMRRARAEILDREAEVKKKESRLLAKEEELKKTKEELGKWNQAITLKARELEIDSKIKSIKKEIEQELYPAAE